MVYVVPPIRFSIIKNKGKCPKCKADNWEILSGMEFILKRDCY